MFQDSDCSTSPWPRFPSAGGGPDEARGAPALWGSGSPAAAAGAGQLSCPGLGRSGGLGEAFWAGLGENFEIFFLLAKMP